jgi:hypothetical protein
MPMNPHRPLTGDVIREISAAGHPVRGAEDGEFARALQKALADEKTSEAVSCLIAYDSKEDTQPIGLDGIDHTYTTGVLERLGFSWPETGTAYIRRFLDKLEQKGFFERGK